MDIDGKSEAPKVKVMLITPNRKRQGPSVDGAVGGYANTVKGKIHMLEGMSNAKISVPSSKP